MPRPISWQPRLREIHRSVAESPRDPYHRADLEKLFRVGESAARKLLRLIPHQAVGSSTVVERADLLEFVGRAIDTEDLAVMLEELRQAPPKPKRRKLRTFVPRDFEPGNLGTVTKLIRMRRGEVTLLFDTLEQLVSQLHQLSTVVESPDFERRFCTPQLTPEGAATRQEVDELLADLEELEAEHRQLHPHD